MGFTRSFATIHKLMKIEGLRKINIGTLVKTHISQVIVITGDRSRAQNTNIVIEASNSVEALDDDNARFYFSFSSF